MSINLYEGFKNKISGEYFRCLSSSEDSFTFEWIVQPKGYIPFEHIHLHQDEIFHIKSGELKIIINGQESIGWFGDSITVPRGKRHIAINNSDQILSCVVEYKPGLDTYKFFQCFGGLTLDGDFDQTGSINIPKMCYFTKKMDAKCLTRPTSIPNSVFRIAINFFYGLGIVLGWYKLFNKYTRD